MDSFGHKKHVLLATIHSIDQADSGGEYTMQPLFRHEDRIEEVNQYNLVTR